MPVSLIDYDRPVCRSRCHTVPDPTADFDKFIVEQTEKWAKVVHAANIKME